jgi:cystathionine beta-lyase/cystathionine gamma-synthase
VVPPISLATTYKQPLPGEPIGPDYGRAGNPTRDALQENLAAMEGASFCKFCGRVLRLTLISGKVFSSGLAATAAITNLFKTGDHIILNDDGYGGKSLSKTCSGQKTLRHTLQFLQRAF